MTSGVRGDRGYVLVADDNVAARIQISSILEESGYAVVQVENGEQASSALLGHAFDAALLDVSMPDRDGPDIVPVARQVNVPVIGVSPASQGTARWSEVGVEHVVEKPVARDALLNALQQILSATTGEAPVDLQHLAQYTAGDKTIERELANLFSTSSDRYLLTMAEKGAGQDWRIAAHSLKGSAKGIGAGRVAQLAEHAESIAGEVAGDKQTVILAELRDAVTEVEQFFATYLGD